MKQWILFFGSITFFTFCKSSITPHREEPLLPYQNWKTKTARSCFYCTTCPCIVAGACCYEGYQGTYYSCYSNCYDPETNESRKLCDMLCTWKDTNDDSNHHCCYILGEKVLCCIGTPILIPLDALCSFISSGIDGAQKTINDIKDIILWNKKTISTPEFTEQL